MYHFKEEVEISVGALNRRWKWLENSILLSFLCGPLSPTMAIWRLGSWGVGAPHFGALWSWLTYACRSQSCPTHGGPGATIAIDRAKAVGPRREKERSREREREQRWERLKEMGRYGVEVKEGGRERRRGDGQKESREASGGKKDEEGESHRGSEGVPHGKPPFGAFNSLFFFSSLLMG